MSSSIVRFQSQPARPSTSQKCAATAVPTTTATTNAAATRSFLTLISSPWPAPAPNPRILPRRPPHLRPYPSSRSPRQAPRSISKSSYTLKLTSLALAMSRARPVGHGFRCYRPPGAFARGWSAAGAGRPDRPRADLLRRPPLESSGGGLGRATAQSPPIPRRRHRSGEGASPPQTTPHIPRSRRTARDDALHLEKLPHIPRRSGPKSRDLPRGPYATERGRLTTERGRW